MRLDARAGADRITLDFMAGSGLSFVSLSGGKNVVRTGTEFVNDPESGQPIEQPRFSCALMQLDAHLQRVGLGLADLLLALLHLVEDAEHQNGHFMVSRVDPDDAGRGRGLLLRIEGRGASGVARCAANMAAQAAAMDRRRRA